MDDLLVIALIKHYSEKTLIETIKQETKSVDVTFSEKGTSKWPAQEIFRALEDIPLKVDIESGEKLTVQFLLKKNMHDYEWLQYILKFVKKLNSFIEKDEKAPIENEG